MSTQKMTKAEKETLLEFRKGKLALKQIREITRLLNEAGIPEFVTMNDCPSNGPQVRLKWFLMRRKDVKQFEQDEGLLTPTERAAIDLLIPYRAKP